MTDAELQDFTEIATPDMRLGDVLAAISQQVHGVHAIVVGDRSGLPIASSLRGRTSMNATAMATLAMTAASKITNSLALPSPEDITIRAGAWHVVIQSLGNGCTLAAVAGPGTDPASLSWIMRLHSDEIRTTLDEMR